MLISKMQLTFFDDSLCNFFLFGAARYEDLDGDLSGCFVSGQRLASGSLPFCCCCLHSKVKKSRLISSLPSASDESHLF